MSQTPRQLFEMLRHVRAAQLFHRIRLRARFNIESQLAERFQARLKNRRGPASLRPALPSPCLPLHGPSAHVEDDHLVLVALGKQARIPLPLSRETLDSAPEAQAWRMEVHQQLYLHQLPSADLAHVVLGWIECNPPYAEGAWLDAWNSNAVSIRVLAWLDVLAQRKDLDDDLREAMTASLVEQLLYLEPHLEQDIGGNHILRNIRALMWGAACIDSAHSARWARLGERLLMDEVAEQFLPDGMHFERSASYHLLAVIDILTCWQLLDAGETRDHLTARLDDMVSALKHTLHPDGYPSLFNDSLMSTHVPGQAIIDFWEQQSNAPVLRYRVLDMQHAGYTALCIDDSYLLWDCGRIAPDHLPAHGHGDCLAFEWSIGPQRVVVDTGVYQYAEGPRRRRSRSTVAHNTVTLDDQDQCDFFGAFRVGRRLNILERDVRVHSEGFEAIGAHDGYQHLAGRPVHRRRISATADTIQLDDRIVGGSGQMATARLLLHPDVSVSVEDRTAVITAGSHTVQVTASAALHIQPAPWYPDIGVERQTVQLRCDYGRAPVDGWMRLVRVQSGSSPA